MTEQQERMLTEFLGACWHEWYRPHGWAHAWLCSKCSQDNIHHDAPRKEKKAYLDFTDWRVVGRLIEKVGGVTVIRLHENVWEATQHPYTDAPCVQRGTPQESICAAVIAYLKETWNDEIPDEPPATRQEPKLGRARRNI